MSDMDNLNTSKTSFSQKQSSLFISNLRKEMDKMSSIYKKDEMVKYAHQYIRDGMSTEETQELLKIDGFDPMLVEAYMKNISPHEEFAEDTSTKWGFDIEDSHGRIYSSSELNIVISAEDRESAMEKAQEEIDKVSIANTERIVDIYKV